MTNNEKYTFYIILYYYTQDTYANFKIIVHITIMISIVV